MTARVFSPEDSLLHVCAHASCSANRYSLRWVSDAWHLLEKHPDLDWPLVLDCAFHDGLTRPLSVMLTYLQEALSAPVPTQVLEALRTRSARYLPIAGNCNSPHS